MNNHIQGGITKLAMQPIIAAVLLALSANFWLPALAPCHAENEPAKTPSTQEIYGAIKKYTNEMAKRELESSKEASILKKPEWKVFDEFKIISYSLGKIKPGATGFDDTDPYKDIFEDQLRLATITFGLVPQVPPGVDLKSHVANAEKFVLQMVVDAESNGKPDIVRQRLSAQQDLFDAELAMMKVTIKDYATSKGYTAESSDRSIASTGFPIFIVTEPTTGTVKVLPYLIFRKCQIFKKPAHQWPWRTLVGNPENLIGVYYYVATWPGGRRSEGRIEVRSEGTRTFRPAR